MSWRPTNWQELIQQRGDWIDLNSLEVGADTILEPALLTLEKEIRAHTNSICADAIIGGKLWKQMLGNK